MQSPAIKNESRSFEVYQKQKRSMRNGFWQCTWIFPSFLKQKLRNYNKGIWLLDQNSDRKPRNKTVRHGTEQETERADQREGSDRTQGATKPVTVSVQPLHQHHATTPSTASEWDEGTSGSHNVDYLQPQWGNDTKMPLAGETGETERWRKGKEREGWGKKRERQEGFPGHCM